MRYFIQLSYQGAAYGGWQVQPNAPSVQETLNRSLSLLLNREVYCIGAGRTDTGVHARMMFAHFDLDEAIEAGQLVFRLNRFLPADIAVQHIFEVPEDAHARFSALSRSYEYHIETVKNPFATDSAWILNQKLHLEAMHEATKHLTGTHDFGAFARSNTQTHTNICTVEHAYWEVWKTELIFHISANRFLRNMVRAITGTLVEVGLNKISPDEFLIIMNSKDRKKAGTSAPAKGLYLTRVTYPPQILKHV